ncbi:MAG: sugar transferase [Leptolyngbya sp. SIO1D8]|nr:sugar transferase [Leptolyngbya sp. SIO1D8]
MVDGIYTLANDKVFDQLVALLNSIEANAGKDYPVCVIAYNDELQRVRQELEKRPNVTLLDDQTLFQFWEDFSYDVWKSHPTALSEWKNQGITTRFYRVGENHRYCAFDEAAPFDRFIYLDADTLVMGPLEPFFEALNENDVAVYDFQFKDPSHIFNLESSLLVSLFGQSRIEKEIFCSGCYASKKGLFSREELAGLVSQLEQGDADVLYLGAPNQSVLNYIIMKSGRKVHNLALNWPADKKTGNSVTSPHFVAQDNVLYDKGARLSYLHYIGVSSRFFKSLCAGENIEFPYRDIFLHYRYLSEPENRPKFKGKPVSYKPQSASLPKRLMRKLGLST